MSDLKFACPNCQQHIQCEEGYAGMQIACPACHSNMFVPHPVGAPAPAMAQAPAPVQAPGLRVSASAPPPPPAPAIGSTETGKTCPSCGNPVAPAAIMCIKCGTNLRTGQKMAAPGRPGAAVRPVAGPVPWYKNADISAMIVLGIMVALYGSAWLSPLGALAYFGFWALLSFAAAIMVLISAFKDSVGTGFLTLCVPFYVLYFVYAQCDSRFVKAMYSLAQIGIIGFWLMPSHGGD